MDSHLPLTSPSTMTTTTTQNWRCYSGAVARVFWLSFGVCDCWNECDVLAHTNFRSKMNDSKVIKIVIVQLVLDACVCVCAHHKNVKPPPAAIKWGVQFVCSSILITRRRSRRRSGWNDNGNSCRHFWWVGAAVAAVVDYKDDGVVVVVGGTHVQWKMQLCKRIN